MDNKVIGHNEKQQNISLDIGLFALGSGPSQLYGCQMLSTMKEAMQIGYL